MKLDIGAGESPKAGYKTVDLFTKADIQDDVRTLATIEDDSVDEINTTHLLEHLADKDVSKAISAMYRVLKKGGFAYIEVPNLIWVLEDFLAVQRDEDRWGWKLQTIFGLQSHDGEFHKTGFSGKRLSSMLIEAGFSKVEINEVFSEKYNQGVIEAKAYKQ